MQLIIAIIVATFLYNYIQKLYRRMWDEKLNIDISFEDNCLEPGNESNIVEVINNDKFLPLPILHVKFATSKTFDYFDEENAVITDRYYRNDVFSVMGNKKVTRRLTFIATKRGFFTITGVNIIAKDFFITRTFAKSIPNYSELYVFPGKINTDYYEVMCNSIFGEIETKRSLFEDPFSFRGIREYNNNDSMSRINWRASAKTGQLMVNQYGHTAEYRVKLFLNLDTNYMLKSYAVEELSIELISSLAKTFLEKNVPVMVTGNGRDIVTEELLNVDFGLAKNHLVTIDKGLARIGKHDTNEEFLDILDKDVRLLDDSIAYVVVSAYCSEELLLKLDYIVSKGMSVTLIVPYYDVDGFLPKRGYIKGWEVKFDEV